MKSVVDKLSPFFSNLKFLIDAQLPKRLSDHLNTLGINSLHSSKLPNSNRTSDKEIIQIADLEGRVVVSKDIDFYNSHILRKEPKKLLLISTGNIGNEELIEIFSRNLLRIETLFQEFNLIQIDRESLIVVR